MTMKFKYLMNGLLAMAMTFVGCQNPDDLVRSDNEMLNRLSIKGILADNPQEDYPTEIDLENGITEKGRIADNRRKDYKNRIDRIIFIEDNFYTISRSTINAVNSDNLNKISSISK